MTFMDGFARTVPAIAVLAAATCTPWGVEAQKLPSQRLEITVGEDAHVSRGSDFPHVEPHLVVLGSDPPRFVAAAMTMPEIDEGARVRVYRSEDGGDTWAGSWLPASSADGARVGWGDDPWLAAGPDGSLYLSHLPDEVWRSADTARSWNGPARLPRGEAGPFDYTKLAVDRTDGPRRGLLYASSSQADRLEDGENIWPLALFRSTDGGRSFLGPVHVQPNNFNNQNGELVVLPDGTVVATLHEIGTEAGFVRSPRLWTVRSRDGGRTYSVPYLVTEGFTSTSPMLAVDRTDGPRRGRVYAAWAGLDGDRDSYLAHSDDAGATWSAPRRFAARDSGAHVTAVMVAVDRRGVVGLAWQEPRPEAGEGCFQFRFAASGDGGETFAGPVPVSSAVGCAPDPDATPGITRRWPSGGDYFGLVPVPGGGFRALWSDARSGTYQLWSAPLRVRRH